MGISLIEWWRRSAEESIGCLPSVRANVFRGTTVSSRGNEGCAYYVCAHKAFVRTAKTCCRELRRAPCSRHVLASHLDRIFTCGASIGTIFSFGCCEHFWEQYFVGGTTKEHHSPCFLTCLTRSHSTFIGTTDFGFVRSHLDWAVASRPAQIDISVVFG